jgi:hypothetical protein
MEHKLNTKVLSYTSLYLPIGYTQAANYLDTVQQQN